MAKETQALGAQAYEFLAREDYLPAFALYQQAAGEAEKSSDLEYAALLYKQAAINYERDREFINFSAALYRSRDCHRRFLTLRLINSKKIRPITESQQTKGLSGVVKGIFLCLALSFSYIAWGYGERPWRTFFPGSR